MKKSPPAQYCKKPVGRAGVCSLRKHHSGRCAMTIGRAVVPEREQVVVAPDLLTPEQIGEVLSRASLFLDWITAVRERALELMQKGHRVPGVKAVAKNTRYAWNREETSKTIAKRLGLKESDVTETKLKSPSKVKKLVPADRRGIVDKITWRPFDVCLAPETDRRTEIPSTKISFQPVHHGEDEDD